MRRSLAVTVAGSIVMVLVALLVPMAVLLENYALEDRLATAALEVQATETVVSRQDKGAVSVYVERINRDRASILTTVLYPDGTAVGPVGGEDARVLEARRTGRARVDDVPGGAQILVPVSLGGSSALPQNTPVVRISVLEQGFAGEVRLSWALLAVLGLALLVGSLVVADRLGRSVVVPMRSLADMARRVGAGDLSARIEPAGPPEAREAGAAMNGLVIRVGELLRQEREAVADLSHRLRTPVTALRLGVEALGDERARSRLSNDIDQLQRSIDGIVREAQRSQREGMAPVADAAGVVRSRAEFWRPLAEDQGRQFSIGVRGPGRALVRASEPDLEALMDALLDNAFSYTPEGTAISVRLVSPSGGGATLVVEDAGPGLPPDRDLTRRGVSQAGSTGLGLDIVRRTAEASGGQVQLDRSVHGGAAITVVFGSAADWEGA